MDKCKNCGDPITRTNRMLGDFCCEDCFWEFGDKDPVTTEDLIGAGNVTQKKDTENIVEKVTESTQNHWDCIEKVVLKKGRTYLISNKSLQPYLSLLSWELFLKNKGLMVVRIDDLLSKIEKSIL